jgi:hypothetical protein
VSDMFKDIPHRPQIASSSGTSWLPDSQSWSFSTSNSLLHPVRSDDNWPQPQFDFCSPHFPDPLHAQYGSTSHSQDPLTGLQDGYLALDSRAIESIPSDMELISSMPEECSDFYSASAAMPDISRFIPSTIDPGSFAYPLSD